MTQRANGSSKLRRSFPLKVGEGAERMIRPALLAALLLTLLTVLLLVPGGAGAQTATVDYDTDDNGRIEVSNLLQLNAISLDLDGDGSANTPISQRLYDNAFPNAAAIMGCGNAQCTGYELAADLDFDTNGDGEHTSADDFYDFASIGNWGHRNGYSAVFHGNHHSISNLRVPLFDYLTKDGEIYKVQLLDVDISSDYQVGALVTHNFGFIVAVFASGTVSSSNDQYGKAGMLVGRHSGTILASYAFGMVSSEDIGGGLVGQSNNDFPSEAGRGRGDITASYAVVRLGGGGELGGLVGSQKTGTVTDSFWDSWVAGSHGGGAGHWTTTFQAPTGYDYHPATNPVFQHWNNLDTNLDGTTDVNALWYFGASGDYPVLEYQQHSRPDLTLPPGNDYDTDDDGLIEVNSLDQLNAIRWDLSGDGYASAANAAEFHRVFPTPANQMGCPPVTDKQGACTGYELTADLDFDTNGDRLVNHNDDWHNERRGWRTIGGIYQATFDGNGHTIMDLRMDRSDINAGLFARFGPNAVVRHLSLIDAIVRLNSPSDRAEHAGVLAALNEGLILGVHVERGQLYLTNGSGTIKGVGLLVGKDLGGRIVASHVDGTVTATGAKARGGGMIGLTSSGTTFLASYASVLPTGTGDDAWSKPLAHYTAGATATHTYWDSNALHHVAPPTGDYLGVGHTAAALKAPTGYTGIYADWDNLDIDGDGVNDPEDTNAFWHFGAGSDYPRLVARADYDADDDGLIEVNSLARLNAIRWDLDGDGMASSGNESSYADAFPNPAHNMGCPTSGCAGYELVADLDFDENGDGQITGTGDPAYWDGGKGWKPIGANLGTWAGVLEGNGHSIRYLFINRGNANVGLFNEIGSSGIVRNLDLLNSSVRSDYTRGNSYVGLLAARNSGLILGVQADGTASFRCTGGTSPNSVGTLVGGNSGRIIASHASGSVSGSSSADWCHPHAGGLIGYAGSGSATIASYSTASVSATGSNGPKSGGLIGNADLSGVTVANSYWDTQISGKNNSAGGAGKTTAQLQTPTGYTGIYAAWDNLDVDGDGTADPEDTNAFWYFGGSNDYPRLGRSRLIPGGL